MPTTPRIISRQQSETIFWVQLILVGLTGLLAAQCWYVGEGMGWTLFACLCAGTIVAMAFRLGWLVPCIVIGTIVGLFLDPLVKSGSLESQMWETAWHIGGGIAVGSVVGVVALCAVRGSTG